MQQLGSRLQEFPCPLIIIGDKKGPLSFDVAGAELISLEMQESLPFQLSAQLPTGHYSRKNLGYLMAISRGATCIYETDDDNTPLPNWSWRDENVTARRIQKKGWVNIYRLFSDSLIWPRGLPLDQIHGQIAAADISQLQSVRAPIQQGLANGAPDVDAIWRLLLDAPITFNQADSFVLPKGLWCPFNSQSTWWWPMAYPLMYLPSYCSFRMTDIWRSYVAQRCLWELDLGVVFHSAEVFQERNPHNLMRDFKDEVQGYLSNQDIADVLTELELKPGVTAISQNILRCYERLVESDYFPESEITLLHAWLTDLASIEKKTP